jgi:glyoxylase-like metal-dependent hydrolase (beta-lactamase superfamily II)
MAKKFLAAAQQATSKGVKRLVITHFHGDHTGGIQFVEGAEIIAHQNCRAAMAKLVSQPKPANWAKRENWADGTEEFKWTLPNQTYSERMTFYDGDTQVELIYPGLGHTDGDTLVYLPKQKIMFIGDIGGFGVTPLNGSGYVAEMIKTCDKILDMDVDTIVPGHGPVGGKAELADMRDYFVLIQREGKKRFDAGMTAGRAAADIDLGKYKNWADADRIATNMARMYAEFSGTITPDQDFPAFIKAREEYTALKNRG